MKDATKEEYIAIILQLIYFKQKTEYVIPECDMINIDKAIETIRYWYQFKK